MTPGQIPTAGDKPGALTRRRHRHPTTPPPPTRPPRPIIRLDKMETYAEILVTVCVTGPSPSPTRAGRPPNCSRALKHLFQLALPLRPRDFTFSRCHLHITLNQNPQWETGEGGVSGGEGVRTRKREWETKPWRSGSEGKTHWHFMKWRCDKTLRCIVCDCAW